LWSRSGTRKKTSASCAEADVQLVSRLKQRDEQAFLVLYDRHHRSVYRFLTYMTGSIAIAEELTQEVFVVILNAMCSGSLGQFDPEKGTLEGYLLGIARNFAREEHRRSRRLLPLDTVLETPEWSQLLNRLCQENRVWDVSEVLAARTEMKILYSAILELPSHYREVLVLCNLQERSYQEAATILQCSEGTIASRLNRAKTLLAAKLRRPMPNEVKAAAI